MIKYLISIAIIFLSMGALANNDADSKKAFEASFQSAVEIGKSLKDTSINMMQSDAMKQLQKDLNVQENPDQTKYFDEKIDLKKEGELVASTSEVTQDVSKASKNRATLDSSETAKSNGIIKDAESDTNKKDIFCLDGNCADQTYKANDEFNAQGSNLSGVIDGSKQLKQNGNSYLTFNGNKSECSRSKVNYYNCCDYKGWGVDWFGVKCSEEEKKLAQARKDGRAVNVGKYCAHKIGPVCRSHHEVYCTFESKQARIIQEQSRRKGFIRDGKKIRNDFGSAKNPNCKGFTPEQLQQIKFDEIDFTEFFSDLNSKIKQPDIPQAIERMKEKITQKAGSAFNGVGQ